jgi:hypothetical protein
MHSVNIYFNVINVDYTSKWSQNILGTNHADNDKHTLLAYYATICVKFLETFRDNLSVPSSRGLLTHEDGTTRLYQKRR